MPRSFDHVAVSVEVNSSHRASDREPETVNDFHPDLDAVQIRMAKASVGAAIAEAIGGDKLEAFGHAGKLSQVCSGEKVPEYLARIYQDTDARRRLGLELLKGTGVTVETVIRWKDERLG